MLSTSFYVKIGGIILSAILYVFFIIRIGTCYIAKARQESEEDKPSLRREKQKFVIFIGLTIMFTCLLTVPVTILVLSMIMEINIEALSVPNNISTSTIDTNITAKLHVVARHDWVAQPPVHPANVLKLPVPYVIILHTGTDTCTDNSQCIRIVRQIQNFHIDSSGWSDIVYNFLIGGNGYVYEGRGWNSEGANALGWNNKSIGIAFIGTFETTVPSEQQIIAYQQLIQKGINKGYISSDYTLFAKSQLSDTDNPGKALSEVIKTWPHWTEKPGKLHMVARHDWVAQPPVHPANVLKLPVPNVIILHTGTDTCMDNGQCVKIVRQVQNFNIDSSGWWDIAFNFLVGGNGYVYEGRGWKSEGANALGWNDNSIGIAFIGTFQTTVPSEQQITAYQQLIQEGVNKGYITSDYKLFAHRQLSDTQSPGEAFYEVIKTWPHWTEKPEGGF